MKAGSTRWMLACALVVGLAAGCNRGYDEERTSGADPAPGAAEVDSAAGDVRDAWITTKIEAKYFADPDVKGRSIEVSTSNGVVTLAGIVDDPEARRQAIAIAEATDGVTRVDAQLVERAPETADAEAADPDRRAASDRDTNVPAPAGSGAPAELGTPAAPVPQVVDRTDNAWVTTKIQAQFFTDDQIKSRRIDVSTNNGVVTLAGQVDSQEEQDRAVRLAQQTEGVRRVDNQLRLVETPGDPRSADADAAGSRSDMESVPPLAVTEERISDDGITARVQSKFFLDERLTARVIDVETKDGVVTLSGNVGGPTEKQAALSLARSVDGVRDVQDQLTMEQGIAGPDARSGAGTESEGPMGDEWTTTRIQSDYFLDDEVKKGRVQVQVSDGVVTLTGSVPSAQARERAESTARNTPGVKEVRNQLAVGSVEGEGASEPETSPATPREPGVPGEPQPESGAPLP